MIQAIIIITVAVTIAGLRDDRLMSRLRLEPYQVAHRKQWYRVLTHIALHADWIHLTVNMLVLYSFGDTIILYFRYYLGSRSPQGLFLSFYLLAAVASSLHSLARRRDDPHYAAIGASGAISAVVFCAIFFDPYSLIYLFGVVPVPGVVFAALYLAYSIRMARRGGDNIAHDAHLFGALFGLAYPIIINWRLAGVFIDKLLSPLG